MVHLTNLMVPENVAAAPKPTEAEQHEDGFSVHAGLWETSAILFLRPDLVSPGFRQAPPQTGSDWADLERLARVPDWPGYFGSPRLATASYGVGSMNSDTPLVDLALKILDGFDDRQVPRMTDVAAKTPANIGIDRDALEREATIERRQREWLAKHPLPAELN
jgi:hypothetical protein